MRALLILTLSAATLSACSPKRSEVRPPPPVAEPPVVQVLTISSTPSGLGYDFGTRFQDEAPVWSGGGLVLRATRQAKTSGAADRYRVTFADDNGVPAILASALGSNAATLSSGQTSEWPLRNDSGRPATTRHEVRVERCMAPASPSPCTRWARVPAVGTSKDLTLVVRNGPHDGRFGTNRNKPDDDGMLNNDGF